MSMRCPYCGDINQVAPGTKNPTCQDCGKPLRPAAKKEGN